MLGAGSLLLIAVYPFAKRFTYLAAAGAGPHLQVGRAGGVGGRHRLAVVGGNCALCRLGAVDHRLRHHLCPPGQGGRRPAWASSRPRSDSVRRHQRWLVGFYAGAVLLWGAAGVLAGAHVAFAAGAGCWRPRSSPGRWRRSTRATPAIASQRFKSNQLVGWLLFGGLVADMALAALLGLTVSSAHSCSPPPCKVRGHLARRTWARASDGATRMTASDSPHPDKAAAASGVRRRAQIAARHRVRQHRRARHRRHLSQLRRSLQSLEGGGPAHGGQRARCAISSCTCIACSTPEADRGHRPSRDTLARRRVQRTCLRAAASLALAAKLLGRLRIRRSGSPMEEHWPTPRTSPGSRTAKLALDERARICCAASSQDWIWPRGPRSPWRCCSRRAWPPPPAAIR